MYINPKKLLTLPNPYNALLLLAIKQNHTEGVSDVVAQLIQDDQEVQNLIDSGYIKIIKGKKNQSDIEKYRLDKKGKEFLEDLDEADVTEDTVKIRDWMAKVYLDMGKKVGNKKRLAYGLQAFSEHTGIYKNDLAKLIKRFLEDEDNMGWNNIAEKALFSSTNIYSRKFNINECRLFDYLQKIKNFKYGS